MSLVNNSPLAFAKAQVEYSDSLRDPVRPGVGFLERFEFSEERAEGVDPHVVTRGSGAGSSTLVRKEKAPAKPYESGVSENSKWDWYQSTVYVADPQLSGLVDLLLKHWELSDWVPAKNLNGYHYGGAIKRGDNVLCHLCWGGQVGVNCKTTSEESGTLAAALAEFGKPHRPTRVDACLDWEEDGLFDSLAAALIAFAQSYGGKGLAINQQGDWVRNIARTLYLGSKDSPIRLVLYEKGYEQGGDAPRNWVRLEVRVRPKNQHREAVAGWKPHDAFGAGWVADACRAIHLDNLEKRAVGTVWKRSDDERSRFALLRQYGPTLERWAAEVGGWKELGQTLGFLALLEKFEGEVGGEAPKGSTSEDQNPGS